MEENKEGFSARQIKDAELARSLYQKTGCPSTKDFKSMIRNNMLLNCPITLRDVENEEFIFGKDIAMLKGKTVRKNPERVKTDILEVPPEILQHNKVVTIAADIMFVNMIPFLVTISENIMFGTVQCLMNKKDESIIKGIKNVNDVYIRHGFRIIKANMDGEFESLSNVMLSELKITLNTTAAN